MENIKIKGFKNLELNCYLFEPRGKPKAVVQVIHGMQEHAQRYEDFASFLAEKGYVVLTSDLRGHGKTAESIEKLGHNDGDIYEDTLFDQQIICEFLKNKYNLPIYIFSHSYGSLLTQRLMQVCHIPEKFVLCGTGNGGSFIMGMGNLAAGFLNLFGQKDKKATSIEKLSLKSYGKKFENGNWLSRDEEVFKKYTADPYCGGSFPVRFYKSLFSNVTKLNGNIDKIPSDKKIFLIAGTADPVGEKGKQVTKLYNLYISEGKNAKIKLYPGARHELLNEINKDEVYADILAFFEE